MNLASALTVEEVLQRPLFREAEVAAGRSGIARTVRWVHILELTEFQSLLHGQELVLTTGAHFRDEPDSSIHFLHQLIEHDAACLCIKFGQYFHSIPERLIALADEHGFPLIIIPHTLPFIDISQDLNSLIINRHHKTLQDLEVVSREFHRLTLTSQGAYQVLKLLHDCTKAQLLYFRLHQPPVAVPPLSPVQQARVLDFLSDHQYELDNMKPDDMPHHWSIDDQTLLLQPVGALGQTWAYIVMLYQRGPQEYDYMLLDSASLSIAQELLRTRYMEERKLFTENRWVDELLSNRLENEEQLKTWMGPDYRRLIDCPCRVCIIETNNPDPFPSNMSENDRESGRFHFFLFLRSSFEKYAYRAFITLHNKRFVVIAFDVKTVAEDRTRIEQALHSLQTAYPAGPGASLSVTAGVGMLYTQLNKIHSSYQEAMQALSLRSQNQQSIIFYEDIGVFQLLGQLNDGHTLQAFIDNHLRALIEHDNAKGSELLRTLMVYLDCDASKQAAAQKLYIVRQSLYYRLDKITELLGSDFLQPERRLAIQVAIRAYRLIHPETFEEL